MDRSRTFLHVTARPCDPVIFQVSPIAFKGTGKHLSAVAMATQRSALFDPENICIDVVTHVEAEMADKNIFFERHPRGLVFSGANVNVRKRVFTHYRIEIPSHLDGTFCFENGHHSLQFARLEMLSGGGQYHRFGANDYVGRAV